MIGKEYVHQEELKTKRKHFKKYLTKKKTGIHFGETV